ncbi:MAG: YhbY family RNA-binding protein [Oscillospiraceae bacterium]|nr:YhbY family RNA-binding protein [Oscillospiraceae bacterium]MDD4413264.1 YhbY family RNA-binding protein [Oscillospiraceae bacterium]
MLTSKQRAFLRAEANGMDPILHIGKGEISPAIIKQADDALTARELFKGKTLETCVLTPREVAETIAAQVNAQIVQVIGRSFVLYKRNEKEPKIQLPGDNTNIRY